MNGVEPVLSYRRQDREDTNSNLLSAACLSSACCCCPGDPTDPAHPASHQVFIVLESQTEMVGDGGRWYRITSELSSHEPGIHWYRISCGQPED